MLKLSIIIPVYKVQGFLRECLDSILESSYPHLEVLGVNDCSPDQSGQILDEFAAADSRVRALRTPHNSGSGGARNVGLDAATGDYLWFVDSDDLVAPGAIERIIAKLEQYASSARPDVLVFDYLRLSETGKLVPSDLPGLISRGQPPEAFTVAEWPLITQYTHTTWNKVVRRDFLTGLGLRFHSGWYQDVPWTYPLLLAAEHISLLNEPGYHYRQRRAGSVTKTASDRHFEVLMQWQRVWDVLDTQTEERTRHAMFHRMIWHCMQVLGNDERIMPQSRHGFFRRVAGLFATCHPGTGYRRPGGIEGTKHFMLQHRWYFGYLLTRSLRRGYNQLRWGHPFGRAFSRGRWSGIKEAALRCRHLLGAKGLAGFAGLYYLVQRKRSPQTDLVVFATDGFGKPSGACAAMDARIGDLYPQLKRVWLTAKPRPWDRSAAPGTAAFYRSLARAKHMITDFEPEDFITKREEAVHVRVLSQTPIEAVGLDRLRVAGAGSEDVERLLTRLDRWDYVVSPNRHASEVIDRAFQIRADTLEFGLPGRRTQLDDSRCKQVREDLGIDSGSKLVCYHPASRPSGIDEPRFDLVGIQRQLPDTTALVVHDGDVVTRAGPDGVLRSTPLPDDVSITDLYEVADIMIGDYRGALVDRAVAGLPVVFYIPDWHDYSSSGLITADLPGASLGPVAHDWPMLSEHLQRLSESDADPDGGTRHGGRFGDWRSGDAADPVVRRIFGPVRRTFAALPAPQPPQTPAGVAGSSVFPESSSFSGESTAVR